MGFKFYKKNTLTSIKSVVVNTSTRTRHPRLPNFPAVLFLFLLLLLSPQGTYATRAPLLQLTLSDVFPACVRASYPRRTVNDGKKQKEDNLITDSGIRFGGSWWLFPDVIGTRSSFRRQTPRHTTKLHTQHLCVCLTL